MNVFKLEDGWVMTHQERRTDMEFRHFIKDNQLVYTTINYDEKGRVMMIHINYADNQINTLHNDQEATIN